MFEDFRLKVFVTVAREKSFTKAAESLHVSQPAVSQNIAELEKMTGIRLFERQRGETVMTPAGESFAVYAKRMLDVAEEAELLFSSMDTSTVRIYASEEIYTYFILPALRIFIAAHPEISVERSDDEECDLLVAVRPSAVNTGSTTLELVYKPMQAFAFTKTCKVLKKILKF